MTIILEMFASLQWLDLASHGSQNKSVVVTLEAQFIFQKHAAQSARARILPGNGLDQPAVLITSSKVAALQTVQQQLNSTDIAQTVDLLEEIFASGIAERVCLSQENIFQQGSRASLPFLPLPESLATRQGTTPTQSHIQEVLSHPDFGTWWLTQPMNQQASVTNSRSRGINTVSRSWGINTSSSSRRGINTISRSQGINAGSSSCARPVATAHQQPTLNTHHQPTLRRQPIPHQSQPTSHQQQQAVPQTQNDLDSDSMYLSDSSDSDISGIRAEVTSIRAQPGTTSESVVEPVVASGQHLQHHDVGHATTHFDDERGEVNRPRQTLIPSASESSGAQDFILPPPPYESVVDTQPPIVFIQNVRFHVSNIFMC
ncbi:hypothetical protein DFH29DRAFT_882162 [Suillus ampliporus]|nr:hypothetical protein DFH29DRAFT_882162 [Suillus ampliporus]